MVDWRGEGGAMGVDWEILCPAERQVVGSL